jgi:hypothetical protein
VIAVASSGKRFGALAVYLTREREGVERVAWVETRNLPTNDPKLAARFMQATAAGNPRVEAPVYHLAVAFHPDDVVTREMMTRVADRLLVGLKLTGHQGVIVAHKDRAHPHMHLMVNRIHPETGRAWDRWQDRVVTQRVLREEERAFGLREVRGRLHQLPDQAVPERAALTSGEHRQATRTGVEPLVGLARRYADEWRGASSWTELHDRLARRGLALERKGQGLVITDGHEQVKASRVHRDLSYARLQDRLGPYQGPTTAPVREGQDTVGTAAARVAAAAEFVRSHTRQDRLHHIYLRTLGQQHEHLSSRDRLAEASDFARRFGQQLDRELAGVYQRPAEARERFDAAVRQSGRDAAVQAMRETPAAYGALRTSEHKKWLGLLIVTDTRDAEARIPDVARTANLTAKATERLVAHLRVVMPAKTAGDLQRADAYVRAVTHLQARLDHSRRRLARVQTMQRGEPDRRMIGRVVSALLPAEVRRLVLLLTHPERALLHAALKVAREVALGRGR